MRPDRELTKCLIGSIESEAKSAARCSAKFAGMCTIPIKAVKCLKLSRGLPSMTCPTTSPALIAGAPKRCLFRFMRKTSHENCAFGGW